MRHTSKTSGKRSTRQRRGASAVEFALVAPVFFLFVFGLVEFGRMVMIQHSMTNACREGCRKAVLASTTNATDVDATVRNYLQSAVPNPYDVDEVRVTAPSTLANIESGTDLTVAVEVDYLDVSWLPLGYFGFNPTIGAESTQQRE